MTFEQFQATRKWCDDLGKALSDARWEDGEKGRGQLYLDCLYIESSIGWEGATGGYCLQIGNSQKMSDDLESLERDLYDWAMAEGYGE